MASETWDEIQAARENDRAERRRAWLTCLLLLPAMASFWFFGYTSGVQHEQKRAAAADWDRNRQSLWTNYWKLGTAAGQKDEVAYLRLLSDVSGTTVALKYDLIGMRESTDPDRRRFLEAAHRCMPNSMQQFNETTVDDRKACSVALRPTS